MHYSLIARICWPILGLCSCCEVSEEKKKRKEKREEKKSSFLSTQCTIQRQSGSPQESHLISSSLHVINLPAQCYCSAGHSSSFRERGIDQAKAACVAHLCVLWANGEEWTKLSSVYNTSSGCFSVMWLHTKVRVGMFKRSECVYHRGRNSRITDVYLCYGWPVRLLMSCGLIQLAIFYIYHLYILN